MSDILQFDPRSLSAPMLFSVLEPGHQASLLANAPKRQFAEGAIIQNRGEKARGFYLIETGSVAIGQFLMSGDFRGVALLGAGDSWGELAMLTERPRVVDAIARADCTVRFIAERDFDALIAREPAIMRKLLVALSAQLQELLNVMSGIRRGSAMPRVAAMLNTLARNMTLPAQISITQQELAEFLGLTRATVNAALNALSEAHAITRGYGTITVVSRESLEEEMLQD
ncbi:Crp/Fnr family transcriptional regulator [Erythrobacter sp. HA6-11]